MVVFNHTKHNKQLATKQAFEFYCSIADLERGLTTGVNMLTGKAESAAAHKAGSKSGCLAK